LRAFPNSKIVFAIFLVANAALAQLTVAQEVAADSLTAQEPELSPLEKAQEQFVFLQAELDSLLRLENRSQHAVDDELELIRVQAKQQIDVIDALQSPFIKQMQTLDATETENQTLFQEARAFHAEEFRLYERTLKLWSDRITTLRNLRRDVKIEDENALELEIDLARGRIDSLIKRMFTVLTQDRKSVV